MKPTTETATVTEFTESRVIVTTESGETVALNYWAIPSKYEVGDEVELTTTYAPRPFYSKVYETTYDVSTHYVAA